MNYKASDIHSLLLVSYAIALPFDVPFSKLTNLIMLLLAANWIRVCRFRARDITFFLMIAFYLWHAAGLLYSQNMEQGIFELDKKISFLLFPIVFSGFLLTKDEARKVLTAFAFSTIAASLICLLYASYQFVTLKTVDYFYYHALGEVIDMHAIYLAMYTCFSFFILTHYYSRWAFAGSLKRKSLFTCCLLYLVIFLFLLSARTVILTFSFIIFCSIIIYGYRRKKLFKAFLGIIAISLLFTSLVLFNENNLERFKEAINYNSEYTIQKQYGGRSTRELIWNCSLKVINAQPWLGVGTGDAQDKLQECYTLHEYGPLLYLPDLQYNAHSQYLQTSIDLGLVGLAILLGILSTALVKAIATKNYLFISFVVLFSLATTTESMLELNKGITFFTFFQCIFIATQWKKSPDTN